ncbi:MAG: TraB/GumN family protein [Flavobacteriaceae bacterium]
MKNLVTKLFIVFITTISIASVQAQSSAKSLLWKVSGNGLSKPSYLYGTVHMICAPDYFLSNQAKTAFAQTDQLTLEINMSDPQEMQAAQKLAMGEKPLSQTLTNEQKKSLEAVLQKNQLGTLAQYDAFTLETLMSLIFMKSFGCADLKFYEMEFIQLAAQSKKPVTGLEKVSEQIEILNQSFTDEQMIAYLDEITPKMCADLVQEYKSQNIDGVLQLIAQDQSIDAEAQRKLLQNRNEHWVKVMPEMMQKQSIFFAFGAAHLAGKQGVVALLKKAGYQVEPVLD